MTVGAPFCRGNSAENETRTYDSDEERSAGRVGGSSARRGKSGVSSPLRKRNGERDRKLRRAKTTRSLFGTAAKPESGRDARKLECTSVELVSDQGCSRLLSRELERADLGRSSHNPTATRKRGAGRRRGRRNERSEEEPGRGNEQFSRAKTGPPAEAIEGVVKTHRSFRLRTTSQGEVRGNRKNEEHGCSWSGSGWHSSATRIAAFAG